ncbi:FAD-dependent pyridine nucleotide-disulfide oxidoreductase [Psychrobacter arcticus 273-4]|uniref:Soluble pyridine nucleotide transhydrogenase n=1 Tax=Psychrobacter arcticus (strain DSM 17307 / VKM B-2377 / 273-4) TaxID=259536 RepID=Q4FS25_PSYA2|nr:Si-specific NAD(P)(+) transhydrogenase [Psychrobacter arcticus]AAZ19183.1 FAD-dependent pyridine nucleotide-disulfide oxidoreductase [Psychrobacter arcticus 273-4]
MGSKTIGDATNDTGKDTETEVSNKESGRVLNPEHTEGKNKKERVEQTHEQVNDDIMHHPDLVNPLDDTRIDVKSGFTKDSQRLKSDKHEFEYDAVVLGAGPAGEAAAMKLAKSGKKVVVIDPREQVGGNCTHVGTIPSKALRQSVFNLINFRRDQMFTKAMDYHQVPLNIVLAKARKVILQQVQTHTRFYERNQIEVIHGWANFIDKNTIRIEIDENTFETITFNKAIITVGSRPYRPDILDFDHPRVFDSDKILQMDYVVKKIIIYGAGVIGCEYASIFTGLGYKVDLINNQNQLLSYLDSEISDAIAHDFRQFGVVIRSNEEIDHLETHDDCVILHLKSGKKIKSDAILWSNGRSGNTEGLNLECLGLKANSRGQLKVDDTYCTEVENIYAAGDVIGWPSLASAAYDQGRCAAAFMVGDRDAEPVSSVPTGIYTIPEISCIGKTEQELTDAKVPYEVGQAFFKHLARAQIIGERSGVLKILFHRETLEILGIHCYGNHASEIIHIGQAVMKCNATLEYFVNTTFNYPTMAEAYRVAALNGLNRVF